MALKTIPQSLIDSVVDVVTKSEETRSKTMQRIVSEGLKHFGVSSVSELSESDQRAFHAWTQLRLTESSCSCSDKNEETCQCEDKIKESSENSEVKKIDGFPNWTRKTTSYNDEIVLFDIMHNGKFVISASWDLHANCYWLSVKNHRGDLGFRELSKVIEYLIKNNIHEQKHVMEDDMPGDSSYHKSGNEDAEKKKTLGEDSASTTMTDKQKFSSLRNINHVEVRRGSAGKNRMDTSLYYMGKKLASMDSPVNSSSRPEYIFITPDGEELLKKQGIVKESVALGADEIATNGAVAVGDSSAATPKHADVLRDTDPHTGVTQYRLLMQYATNNGTKIYPPVSLPGAKSVQDLRSLVEALPDFNDEVENALAVAGMLGE